MKVFLHLYAIVAIILKRFQTMNSQSHVALLLHDYTLLANNTKDLHLKITIEGLCDEVSIKENVLISQVFQPYDGYNCIIKTVVK